MRKKSPKSAEKLDSWQREDAARLAELFKRTPLSQEAFGDQFGIGTQGAVSQYLNGLIPLNLTAALRFARGLGVAVSDISPTLAKELEGLGDPQGALLSGAMRVLPDGAKQAWLDYLQFHLQSAQVAKDVRAHYTGMIQQLKEQFAMPFGESNAANDAVTPAKKQVLLKTIKGRKS